MKSVTWLDQVFKFLGLARYRSSPTPAGDGAAVELLADPVGRLEVVARPFSPQAALLSRAVTPAAGAVVGAGARKFVACWGFNKGASTLYVGLYNRTTLPAAGTEQPTEQWPVPPGQAFAFMPPLPLDFATGIVWAASTTPGVWTAGAGADVGITVVHQT